MAVDDMMQGMGMDPSMMQGMDPSMMGMDPSMMGMDPSMMQDPEDAGRGGDTVLAHLTVGEVVLPAEIAAQFSEEILGLIGEEEAMARTVGHPSNSINPETGYPEFWSYKDPFGTKKAKKRAKREAAAMRREMKRQAEEMRIFAENERVKTRENRLSRARKDLQERKFLEARAEKIRRAQKIGTETAGDIAEVSAERKGEGKLRSGQQARDASTRPSYQKFRPKEMGLSLALRSSQTRRPK